MKREQIELSLIIPALAEEQMIVSTLQEVAIYLQNEKSIGTTEVIVVAADGGDRTAELAKQHAKLFTHFKVIEPGKKVGKGRDVKLGVEAAHGAYIVFTDADLATPIHHLKKLEDSLRSGADVVIGTRAIKTVHETFERRMSSMVSNALIQLIVLPGIKDTQCGFKGFRADAAQRIFKQQQIMGWGFDIEILAMARKFKYKIVPQEIKDWSDPKGDNGLVGESHMGAMINTLKELIRIRVNLWKGIYK